MDHQILKLTKIKEIDEFKEIETLKAQKIAGRASREEITAAVEAAVSFSKEQANVVQIGVMALKVYVSCSGENVPDGYLESSFGFLVGLRGEESVLWAGVEEGKALIAYIMPLDPDGRLRWMHYYYRNGVYADLQLRFYEKVSMRYGFERKKVADVRKPVADDLWRWVDVPKERAEELKKGNKRSRPLSVRDVLINKAVGFKIRELRTKTKLSSVDLAERLSITQPSLSRYENGSDSVPLATIFDIADILNVPASTMIMAAEKAIAKYTRGDLLQ